MHTFNLLSRPFPFGRMMIQTDGDQSQRPSLLDHLPHKQKELQQSSLSDVYINLFTPWLTLPLIKADFADLID